MLLVSFTEESASHPESRAELRPGFLPLLAAKGHPAEAASVPPPHSDQAAPQLSPPPPQTQKTLFFGSQLSPATSHHGKQPISRPAAKLGCFNSLRTGHKAQYCRGHGPLSTGHKAQYCRGHCPLSTGHKTQYCSHNPVSTGHKTQYCSPTGHGHFCSSYCASYCHCIQCASRRGSPPHPGHTALCLNIHRLWRIGRIGRSGRSGRRR